MNYIAISVECEYIMAGMGYDKLVDAICLDVCEGDLVVISETPISTLEGNLVDESSIDYSFVGWFIVEVWCKLLWGYVLSFLCSDSRTVSNLRRMPVEARSHKEFIYKRYGLKHALQPSGEAGVDLSNVPGSFVSLLPEDPIRSAFIVKELVRQRCGVCVEVMIIDTDPTYEFFGRYYTSIPLSVDGIVNDLGIYGYLLRFFSKRAGATPLACTCDKSTSSMIEIANTAEQCQENSLDNFFETIYNMTDRFDVGYDGISVEMLEEVKHIPAVIIRRYL